MRVLALGFTQTLGRSPSVEEYRRLRALTLADQRIELGVGVSLPSGPLAPPPGSAHGDRPGRDSLVDGDGGNAGRP